MLRGTAEEVTTQITALSLVVENDYAIGTFELRATATSELGGTGLRSESVTTEIGFSLEPETLHVDGCNSREDPKDALDLGTFADFLSAELVDSREQLLYAIDLPETERELDYRSHRRRNRRPRRPKFSPQPSGPYMLRTEEANLQPVNLTVEPSAEKSPLEFWRKRRAPRM